MPKVEYLTVAEVAAHYRKKVATVRYWRHIGLRAERRQGRHDGAVLAGRGGPFRQ